MKNNKSLLAKVLVVAMVVCLMVCCVVPFGAMAANDAVNSARSGVLQVNMIYSDENVTRVVNGGTGFLVNDDTLVTCHHCVSLSDEEINLLATETGKSVAEVRNRLSYSVTVSRDVTVPANMTEAQSFEMDFAILRLSSSLQGRTPLKIRSSAEVQQTESVYAIGFPALPALQQSYNTYTSEDATITNGVVNKVAIGTNAYSGANTSYIMTSCDMDNGNSGGPMVDENGYVIGISQASWTLGESHPDFYYAVAIDQVTEVMDVLGISYEKAGDLVEEPTEEPTEEEPIEEPTEEPTEEEPIEEPTEVKPTEAPVVTPQPQKSGNTGLIIIIAAAVLVVVIVVVVIIIIAGSNKKNAAPAAGAMPPQGGMPPHGGQAPIQGGFVPPAPHVPQAPTAPIADAGETTVLSQDAGETTVLSKSVNGGTLLRKRTGESITINVEQFVIGRERKSVNYCISDNSSISRNHVRLIVRNGVTYLTDLNAANGTFVNGVKVMPRQEIALKSGDKITLSDEELEYKN